MRVLLTCAALLLTAGAVDAQQASYTYFGQGCPTGEPHFSVLGVPRLGGSFVVRAPTSCRLGCEPGGHEAWILTGFSNTQFGGLSLPFDLSVLGSNLCGPLLTSIEACDWTPVHAAPPTAWAEVVYIVPNAQRLLGLSFYQQVFFYSFGCNPRTGCHRDWSTSRGGHGVIGT